VAVPAKRHLAAPSIDLAGAVAKIGGGATPGIPAPAFLEPERVGFADVVMINTFHVWDGPGFAGTREEQFAAFSAVKDEFMTAPHPAWTAVGTTGLLAPNGVVEIQMIAYVPPARP